jgi:hypothetical protein
VSRKPGRGLRWDETDRVGRINEGRRRQVERVQALLAARQAANAQAQLARPGVSNATTIRYAPTSAPADWAPADRGRSIVDSILESVEDGGDRAIMAWPSRPGGGFAAGALAMREARASGRLAYAPAAWESTFKIAVTADLGRWLKPRLISLSSTITGP